MTKRLQVPVTPEESARLHAAARRSGLPLAEWARRHLREKAEESLGSSTMTPREALEGLSRLNGPVGPVEQMIEESIEGRYP